MISANQFKTSFLKDSHRRSFDLEELVLFYLVS